MSWLGDAISEALQRKADALDAALAEIVWLPPAERLIRRREVPMGQAQVLPGKLFPDGLDRCVINPRQELHPDELAKYGETP